MFLVVNSHEAYTNHDLFKKSLAGGFSGIDCEVDTQKIFFNTEYRKYTKYTNLN